MKFVDILYTKSDGIARITINRPEVYNAIRGLTTDEMSEALVDASNDPDVRVAVIAGTGSNAFCSGRDQSEDPTTTEYSGSSELSVN
ncbi:MAG: enoyl-CoA hydratase-related protein, partial [SAR202 cluster bacterium]|nr:enoyl-CoA hydratase-related protein [SAR202 cluster bacterium]